MWKGDKGIRHDSTMLNSGSGFLSNCMIHEEPHKSVDRFLAKENKNGANGGCCPHLIQPGELVNCLMFQVRYEIIYHVVSIYSK